MGVRLALDLQITRADLNLVSNLTIYIQSIDKQYYLSILSMLSIDILFVYFQHLLDTADGRPHSVQTWMNDFVHELTLVDDGQNILVSSNLNVDFFQLIKSFGISG